MSYDRLKIAALKAHVAPLRLLLEQEAEKFIVGDLPADGSALDWKAEGLSFALDASSELATTRET